MVEGKVIFKAFEYPQTRKEIRDALWLRREVLVKEYKYPLSGNFDGLDDQAVRIVFYVDGEPGGTIRMLDIRIVLN